MGAVYRKKNPGGCALCKPHKHGWDPKFKARELALRRELDEEAKHGLTPQHDRTRQRVSPRDGVGLEVS